MEIGLMKLRIVMSDGRSSLQKEKLSKSYIAF